MGTNEGKQALGKKCKINQFLPADNDPLWDGFTHGRLKLCAQYVAQGRATICGGDFYMTRDDHCYCATKGVSCEQEDDPEACVYTLQELAVAEGAQESMEQLQGEANH